MWLSDMTGAQVAHNGNLRATYRNKWHSESSGRAVSLESGIHVIPDTYSADCAERVSAHRTVTVCTRRTSLHLGNTAKRRKPRRQAGLRHVGRVTRKNGESSIPAPFPPPSCRLIIHGNYLILVPNDN